MFSLAGGVAYPYACMCKLLLTGNPFGSYILPPSLCLDKGWASSKEKFKSCLLSPISLDPQWPLACPLHPGSFSSSSYCQQQVSTLWHTIGSQIQFSFPIFLSSTQKCLSHALPQGAWCICWFLVYMTLHSSAFEDKWICIIFLPASKWQKEQPLHFSFHCSDSGVQRD